MDKFKMTHDLYCKAYEICRRADREGKGYIGFRRWHDGFRLIVSQDNCNGISSARMGLCISDWAQNVLYRLQECGFVYGLSLDDYFDRLNAVGYTKAKSLEEELC